MQGNSGTANSKKQIFLFSKYFKCPIHHYIPIRRNITFAGNELLKTQKHRVRSNMSAVCCMYKQLSVLL